MKRIIRRLLAGRSTLFGLLGRKHRLVHAKEPEVIPLRQLVKRPKARFKNVGNISAPPKRFPDGPGPAA